MLFRDKCTPKLYDPDGWRNGRGLKQLHKSVWLRHQQVFGITILMKIIVDEVVGNSSC